MFWRKAVFVLLILFCLSPYGSPPAALLLGLILALVIGNPYPGVAGKPTKLLLQASVVLLGFGMNLTAVIQAGKNGILFTIATIFGTLTLGYFAGRFLKVDPKTSSLISSGTAICGGSAIAAVAPVIDADPEEISVALGTVFILNSIALIAFPIIGRSIGLSQAQFGVWSAVAIHDTSSVVGAAQAYGAEALAIATTVKLARALWIAPVALFFLMINRKEIGSERRKIAVPWFIFLFLLACAVHTFAPVWLIPSFFDSLVNLAKAGMTATLFLIGASLSRATIRKVGVRPMMQGVLLWIVISVAALWAVMRLL
ncbi:MAG: YeiH family protein [Pyrinomonadaceae bacterium]